MNFTWLNALSPLIVLLSVLHLSIADSDCPDIISKSQWGGRRAKRVNYLIIPLPYVIIHHTVTPNCTIRSHCKNRMINTQDYHMDIFGWDDIGCSFFIGGDGSVYEGVGWNYEGSHTLGYNRKSVCISFIGSYQDKPASQKMLDVAHDLIKCGKSLGILRRSVKVLNARQVSSTLSPGSELARQIESWPEWASEP
ncbi:peptidoglycan-recognition protein 1 [Orussus abietinus]|uniref:peptidoglycan-recognition protein 1 n=1 Tax=Orussus abietinus TaxID=222816 RepID=UPI0006256F9E|nr:peptidoglycan-recognition protein 1 [Orussus abietinus]